jgi:hypothetical protein
VRRGGKRSVRFLISKWRYRTFAERPPVMSLRRISIAQFSRQILTFELSTFFRVTDPTWTLSSKLIHSVDGSDWKPVFHPTLA